MSASKVGFIGLGNMGKPMAKRLLSHGFEVTSCAHVRREAIEELKRLGLVELASPQEVAHASDVTITMVRDTHESEVVILGERGVLHGMGEGSTLIMMSTIYPDFCQRVAQLAAARGVQVLDSPVSGGPMGVERGTLALMVGGDEGVIEGCRPILEAMGRIFHCGGVGMGMVTKLANNAVLFVTAAILSEAIVLARAYGMAEERLLDIFKNASANSWAVQNWEFMKWVRDSYIPGDLGTTMGLAMKDLRTCLDVANRKEIRMPLTAVVSHLDWSVYRE
ncbi:MAG TPA: NAD(P)-dependent oxidoreductase [Dehalococcoidia bacterium]|nr:NAD(P)-dependent oxidoreductase [Dehalococcoidia bacterium]